MENLDLTIYGYCALGIAISVILPILRAFLPKPPENIVPNMPADWMSSAKPYLVLGLFSLVAGLLVFAVAGDTLQDWRAALLAGYAWDSTLQKLKPFA